MRISDWSSDVCSSDLFALTFQKTKDFQLAWVWNLDVWTDVFTKPHYWTILLHTLVMATICVVLCVALALPVAYALATRIKRFDNHVTILITFAFLTDATLKIFGWVLFLDQKAMANFLLEQLGFSPGTVGILFTA